jgi:hypothetical protein
MNYLILEEKDIDNIPTHSSKHAVTSTLIFINLQTLQVLTIERVLVEVIPALVRRLPNKWEDVAISVNSIYNLILRNRNK